MQPLNLSSVYISPEYVQAYREGLTAEGTTQDDLIQALMDIHVATAKMSYTAQRAPFPVGQIMTEVLASIVNEVSRLAMERYLFREVLTIPDHG
ncbi:hypothetical protein SEA_WILLIAMBOONE_126 [Gordonia phage WilliamBoone]|nr:hypothetical protein SEA_WILLIAMBOONE_126 [Gordonia phage WilliamBoone]